MLKSTRPVLYRSKQYNTGDALPADDMAMVEAWLEAGSAVLVSDEEIETEKPKAKPASAMAGLPGLSSDGDPDALIGRVPARPVRSRGKKKS
jgi:hypothetical protein